MPSDRVEPLRVDSLIALSSERVAELAASAFGPFALRVGSNLGDDCDAVIVADDGTARTLVAARGRDTAIIVVVATLAPKAVLGWLQCGAQDVLRFDELAAPAFALRLRAAIERKWLERDARTAYATDVDTGLPHRQQLIEHMSQLIALREREPAPMALLALRIEGLATAEARLGREASNVLRRKLGVRLRAGVRASDVVAALGDDHFAVLLGSILAPADAQRVAVKLQRALLGPIQVAGVEVAVASAIGIAQYPADGAQPDALLRHAVGLAASSQAQGRAGYSNFAQAGAAGAANDE